MYSENFLCRLYLNPDFSNLIALLIKINKCCNCVLQNFNKNTASVNWRRVRIYSIDFVEVDVCECLVLLKFTTMSL